MEEVVMGRELRRKQAKKDGKSLKQSEIEVKHPIRSLLIILGALIFVFALMYLISAVFVTKEADWFNLKNKEEDNEETDTTDNSILANAIFKQSEEMYYVYFYDFNNDGNDKSLDLITSTVESSLSYCKVYKVDTSSALNTKYVSVDSGNRDATSLDELKVISPTLIKIEGDKITEYYEDKEITSNFG